MRPRSLLAAQLCVLLTLWPAKAEPPSPAVGDASLQALLSRDPGTGAPVDSLEQLLPLLPRKLRANFTLVYDSRGPFKDVITPNAPRVILFTDDARFILTFIGDPSAPGHDLIETMNFDDDAARFTATGVSDVSAAATATAGVGLESGGFNDGTSPGGAGNATANATSTAGLAGATATATGGGGSATNTGGAATATATSSSLTGGTTDATATGGNGTLHVGKGVAGGSGAKATASASASGATSGNTVVSATDIGGAGGAGLAVFDQDEGTFDAAFGGAGASISADNIVSGSTQGANLHLTQTATGGAGGNTTKPAGSIYGAGAKAGAAGSATSTLSLTETTSVLLDGTANANGGAGGNSVIGSSTVGGSATATVTLSGASKVDAIARATGGAGGVQSDHHYSNGKVGAVGSFGGAAIATSTATGLSGTIGADATTGQDSDQLLESVAATTSGVVAGTSVAQAIASLDSTLRPFNSGAQEVAFVAGAPTAASTTAILGSNPTLATAFGASPVFFAAGELGGGHSSAAGGSQTTTSEIDETADLTQLASRKDLVVGFYGGKAVGTGVTKVTLDIYVNGTDADSQTFATAAAALAYFSDTSVDLGSLATGSTLTLREVLTVTTSSSGSGFYGDLLVSDPPPAKGAAVSPAIAAPKAPAALSPETTSTVSGRFVQAIAAFGASSSAGSALTAASQPATQLLLGPNLGRRDTVAAHTPA